MIRTITVVAGWLCLVGILFVTVNSAESRPHLFPYPSMDRLFAFAAAGFLLGMAYPRHLLSVVMWLTIAAIGLEALQYVRPTRDPRFFDAIVKVLGSWIGVACAGLGLAVIERRSSR